MRAIITGGLGFIGFNFYELYRNECTFLVIDKRGYASNPVAEKTIERLEICDIQDPRIGDVIRAFKPDVIFHFAAESHVDRSILDASPFLKSNVLGTCQLLEVARTIPGIRFVQVSTDEVYGSLQESGFFTETTPIQPNSPYSASKAAADGFVRAYNHTHNLDTVITRCSNNYGPWQFPEKLIPLMIRNALKNEQLPVYGTGKNVRDWIHVSDHCRGIMAAARQGRSGGVYNFGGSSELTNLEVVKSILRQLEKPEHLIRFVTDRHGHDFRYAIDWSLAQRELNWNPTVSFADGLAQTVEWNLQNQEWLDLVTSEQYLAYYSKNYSQRKSWGETQPYV